MNPWEYMSGLGGYQPNRSSGLMLNLESMTNSLGNSPDSRMLQSDINRNVLPGTKTPGMENLNPGQLAQIDRYAWGSQSGLGGLPLAAGYEGVKALSQHPALRGLMSGLGRAGDFVGIPKASEYLTFDQNTSPASGNNVAAFLRGALDRPGSKFANPFSFFQ